MRALRTRMGWIASAALFSGLASVGLVVSVPAQPPMHPMCAGLCHPNRQHHFVARADMQQRATAIDGDDLLTLVNRTPTGALPEEYVPRDLVDLETMRPAKVSQCTPPAHQCLRTDAARAYQSLANAMRAEHFNPHVGSAFRAYRVQCATFQRWAERERGGFCEAVTASALPGHSQHQLGTTLDLFTHDWFAGGDHFREGFGCTQAGLWLAAHAHEHGFVLPYPLHPDYRSHSTPCARRGLEARIDPRTGYRYEPWHLRYLGLDHARAFHEAWQRSGPGSAGEITLEQWLRARRGDPDPVGPAVCDGCNCGACATLATGADTPCGQAAMHLSTEGRSASPSSPPSITSATLRRDGELVQLEVILAVPPGTWTQPPVATVSTILHGESILLPDRIPRSFPALPEAWRVAIGTGEVGWPWQIALASPQQAEVANGFNARIVAQPGALVVHVALQGLAAATQVRLALVSEQTVRDERRLRAP